MRQRDCCAGQISILHPTELGTSVLKLPPTSSQDVNWWGYSKNTISRITALLCWAAALPCNMVISQNVTLHSQRHWKTNYKQRTAASQFYKNYLDSISHLLRKRSILLLLLLAQKKYTACFQKKPPKMHGKPIGGNGPLKFHFTT